MRPISRPPQLSKLSSSNRFRTAPPHHQLPHQPQTPTQCTQQRYASSYRRQRKLLNIPPAPTFGGPSAPTGSSGRSKSANKRLPQGDHIVFNPPSSAPNVYHTPSKFLPKSDPRNKTTIYRTPQSLPDPQQSAHSSSMSSQAPSPTAFPPPLTPLTPSSTTAAATNFQHIWPPSHELPPPVREPYEKKYHLGPEEIEEIRQLRSSDENKWTRTKLAQKFGCTQFFVGMVVQASEERKAMLKEEEARYAYRWRERGGVSMKTRKERQKRRAAWMAEA